MTISSRDLVAILKQHRENSLGADSGELGTARASALDHYHGRPYGNEVEGRSQVVSKDLMEAVDWALPAIMRAFLQSGKLGEFMPVGPDDEPLAEQESDYTNQVMMQENPGFMILHDAVKDTLLLKNGYVKHFWEVEEKVSEEDYTGLTIERLTKLMQDLQGQGAEVEVKGQDSKVYDVDGVPTEFFDIKLQIKKKCGRMVWMAVPTEEVRVSKRCRGSLQDSPFTEHAPRGITRSDLIEMGMPRSFVDGLPALNEKQNDSQAQARDSSTDETAAMDGTFQDRSMDEMEFRESYVRVDYDGDGIAELRKIVTVSDRIPPGEQWNEPIPAVPMTGFVMKRVPHRHVGESLDDELNDIQEIKTTLERQMMDNLYLSNNSEKVVNERANLRDFMVTLPGGIKRIKGDGPVGDAWAPIVVPPVLDKILPAIDYLDKTKEIRTGIRPGSDMDPDMLKEVTKGAFLEHLNRASQKIEMIVRMLAESGVKEAFLQCHSILVRHQDQPKVVQLRGKWVPVNPREWKERTNLKARVGLGTGNEEEKRQKLLLLAGLQAQILQAATAAPPQVYAKMYALFEDVAKAMNFEMPEKYALAPNGPEFQQLTQMLQNRPNPEMAVEQAKITAKEQTEQARMQMQAQVDAHRQQVEAQQQAARMQMESMLEQQRMAMEERLEREKAAWKRETEILIARIKAEASIDVAQLTAQATLTAQQDQASDDAVGDA